MTEGAPTGPDAARAALIGQAARYLVGGAACAAIYAAAFALLTATVLPGTLSVLAVPPAFLLAAACGLRIHGRWTFGEPRERAAPAGRFFLVQFAGLLVSAACAWVVTGPLGAPAWVSIAPSVLLTPVATFQFNRRWVFAA